MIVQVVLSIVSPVGKDGLAEQVVTVPVNVGVFVAMGIFCV